MNRLFPLLTVVGALVLVGTPAAQTDLDALMERVLTRRDESWRKLQQYTLVEHETIQVQGPGGARLYGSEREFMWFPKAGFFVRSPLRIDGVVVADDARRRAEDRFLQRAQAQERRAGGNSTPDGDTSNTAPCTADPTVPAGPSPDCLPGRGVEDVIRQSFEPEFISSANFLRFTFDPGHYALVGRESLMDRTVLKIEYYPTRLFAEGRMRPNRELRSKDEQVQRRMNKTSFVTLWVDPTEHQILQYEFHNAGLDFLPARALVRFDEMVASMRMGQPFANVWLPSSVAFSFRMTLAVGGVTGRYLIAYRDYRLPETSGSVR